MDFTTIFAEYYSLYRGNADDIPDSSDPEWALAIRLGNSAIRRWHKVDNVFWNELYGTLQTAATGDKTIATGDSTYAAPTNMDFYGGRVRIYNSSNPDQEKWITRIDPERVSVMSDTASYAYFTGDPNNGFVLNLIIEGAAPVADYNGWSIDYLYYKKPTFFATNESGTTKPEMSDPNFIVHDMLRNRFRASRNTLGYQTAKQDADQAMVNMVARNTSGSPLAPFMMDDLSGDGFGV
jgi:hypothetical protein